MLPGALFRERQLRNNQQPAVLGWLTAHRGPSSGSGTGAVGGEGVSGPVAEHGGSGWCCLCRCSWGCRELVPALQAWPVQVVMAGWPVSGGAGEAVPLSAVVLGPFSLWFTAVGQLHQPFSALRGWD